MLIEIVYRNGFYMTGKAAEIRQRLAEHSLKYVKVQELLDDLAPR